MATISHCIDAKLTRPQTSTRSADRAGTMGKLMLARPSVEPGRGSNLSAYFETQVHRSARESEYVGVRFLCDYCFVYGTVEP